jgi:hypothetical protein
MIGKIFSMTPLRLCTFDSNRHPGAGLVDLRRHGHTGRISPEDTAAPRAIEGATVKERGTFGQFSPGLRFTPAPRCRRPLSSTKTP